MQRAIVINFLFALLHALIYDVDIYKRAYMICIGGTQHGMERQVK